MLKIFLTDESFRRAAEDLLFDKLVELETMRIERNQALRDLQATRDKIVNANVKRRVTGKARQTKRNKMTIICAYKDSESIVYGSDKRITFDSGTTYDVCKKWIQIGEENESGIIIGAAGSARLDNLVMSSAKISEPLKVPTRSQTLLNVLL